MRKKLIMFILSLRWAYFHISPWYVKFYVDSARTEAHFQNTKTGTVHCNFAWVDPDSE